MVPNRIVVLDALPISPNDKVDRLALPAPAPDPAERDEDRPSTGTEHTLAGIVAHLLEIPSVGRRDDFFRLGGHSLLVSRLALRVRDAFGVGISVHQVFERPTVERLAELIDRSDTLAANRSTPIVRVDRARFRRVAPTE